MIKVKCDTSTHTHAHTHIRTYIHTHTTNTHTHTHKQTPTHTYIYTHTHTCTHTYTQTHTHIHKRTHTNTHIRERIPYSRSLLREEIIFPNHAILLSEEIFTIFDYCIHSSRYTEDVWIQKCVLALNFANAFKMANFSKLKDLQ